MKQYLADGNVVHILVTAHLRLMLLVLLYNLVELTLIFSESVYYNTVANIFQDYFNMSLAQTLKTHLCTVWSCDIIESSFTHQTSMSYDILINSLVNGESVTVTKPDGTTYLEPRPPNRTALAAAKALQNLQNQLNFGTSAINQLTKERNELMDSITRLQEQNKRLQHEINSKTSTTTSSTGDSDSPTTGNG
jgi:peptidoglycan hydrolase CwlO-like protein